MTSDRARLIRLSWLTGGIFANDEREKEGRNGLEWHSVIALANDYWYVNKQPFAYHKSLSLNATDAANCEGKCADTSWLTQLGYCC